MLHAVGHSDLNNCLHVCLYSVQTPKWCDGHLQYNVLCDSGDDKKLGAAAVLDSLHYFLPAVLALATLSKSHSC